MKKILIYMFSLGLCLSCQPQGNKQYARKPIKVNVTEIGPVQSINTSTYIGEIESANSVPLTPLSGGQVKSITVKNGAHVKQGQVILKLDAVKQQSSLNAAKASLKQAEDGFNRINKIYRQGGTTEVQFIEMQTKLEQARSMYRLAQKALDECTLYAPCDGVVSGIDISAGQNIMPGIRIGEIINVSAMNITINVPESKVSQISTGDYADVQLTVLPDRTIRAKVIEKSLTPNKLANTYKITLSLDSKNAEGLIPGMTGKVNLENGRTTAIIIPATCIQRLGSHNTVWVYNNGTAQRREIQTGEYSSNGIIVKSGLKQGDLLITSGGYKLYDGAKTVIAE